MSVPTVDDLLELADPGADAVVETRLVLYGAAVAGPQVLGRFTDEELVGLDGLGPEPSAPSPWYSSLTADEQQIAVTAALRGLTARGAYLATPVDAEAGTFVFQASVDLLALLTMRRHTGTVVVAERRHTEERDWAVIYQQRAGLWLTEYVSHVGLHEFVLSDDAAAATALTTWSGAGVESPAPSFDLTLTRAEVAEQPTELEPVAQSTAAVTITRLDVDDTVHETWTGVYTGPGGSYLSTAAHDGVRYVGADHDAVLAHWLDVLGAA